jgi:hypothetical protein
MLTIVWDPTVCAVVTALNSGCKFTAGYYVSEVLTLLSEWWRERGAGHGGNLIVHAENMLPHKATVSQQLMAQNSVLVAAHSLYSPSLAPSGFYLFAHVKGLLRGESFETGEQVVIGGRGHFESLERWILTKVFLEWMWRLEQYVETDSDYV